MKIDKDHHYHGAALIQIAEDDNFTAINSLEIGGKKLRNAYLVNKDIAVWLKYGNSPNESHSEYSFNFTLEHLESLKNISEHCKKLFVVLICIEDCEICCLPYSKLCELIEMRKQAKGELEKQYVILVTVPSGHEMRVYVNAPNRKGIFLGKQQLVKRKAFPSEIFV